jgi:hypothetical protein
MISRKRECIRALTVELDASCCELASAPKCREHYKQ